MRLLLCKRTVGGVGTRDMSGTTFANEGQNAIW